MNKNNIVMDIPISEIEPKLESIVKREISPSIFINSNGHKFNKNTTIYEIGNCLPKMIWDYERNLAVYRFLNIYSIGTLRVKKIDTGHTQIILPSLDSLRNKFQEKMSSIYLKSELALLHTIQDYLVKIPNVEISLSVIWAILEKVSEEGEVKVTYSFGYNDSDRIKKYIHFLQQLNFINVKNDKIVPAEELDAVRILNVTGKEFHRKILSAVLKKGFPSIKDYLHIFLIDPFLRLSNSYYLPSHQVNKLLEFESIDFKDSYFEIYNKRKTKSVIEKQITPLTECGILEKVGKRWIGIENIFNTFKKEFTLITPQLY